MAGPVDMRAYRVLAPGRAGTVAVAVPEPRAGEVLVRVSGVGLCHSDIGFIDGRPPYPAPYTLGHEIAGVVERAGEGVDPSAVGDAVVAVAHWWCGGCAFCLRGDDHLCSEQQGGPGYGIDGGLADYFLAPAHSLVALGGVDPRHAGVLADAAATAYRVVHRVRPALAPGSVALVIGAGGLGGCAVRLLRLLTPAHVVAVDVAPERRADALGDGAHEAFGTAAELLPVSVTAVLDFVGTDETLAAAARVVEPGGTIALVGAAGGRIPVGWGALPPEAAVRVCLGNTRADLEGVVAIAARGELPIRVTEYAFADVDRAYADLRAGTVRGRAVVVL